MKNDFGLRQERRMIVKGWKNDPDHEFSSVHYQPSDRSIEHDRKRIGEEGLPSWQPHITEVIVEERLVTNWIRIEDAKIQERSN